LPEEQVEIAAHKHGFRQLTRKTISNMLELRAELAKVRKLGYAVDNEENEEGVCCVGCPVWGFAPHPIAAISVSGPTFRMTAEKIPIVAQSIVKIANALSKDLGMRTVPVTAGTSNQEVHAHVIGA